LGIITTVESKAAARKYYILAARDVGRVCHCQSAAVGRGLSAA
jgi:hypothetical protein